MSGGTIGDQVKDLATAVSTQAQVANRIWLATMTVAIIGAIPRVVKDGAVDLPFSLGAVDEAWFFVVVFAMLCVLVTAFCAAHAQQIRTMNLAHEHIKTLPHDGKIHPRDLLDMYRWPAVNRVASLAQSLRGPYQFHAKEHLCPQWLRLITTAYYTLLKLAATFVYFGLPASCLIVVFGKLRLMGMGNWAAIIGASIAGVALLQVTVFELWYMGSVSWFLAGRGGTESHKNA